MNFYIEFENALKAGKKKKTVAIWKRINMVIKGQLKSQIVGYDGKIETITDNDYKNLKQHIGLHYDCKKLAKYYNSTKKAKELCITFSCK